VAAEFRDVVLDSGYPIAECVRTGDLVLIRDRADAARYPDDAALHRLRGDGASLLVPLRAPGRVIGAFILTLDPGALTPDVVARARTFANVAAASIARARAARGDRVARRLVEAVIADMPVGVGVTDTEGALTLSNPALEAIWHGSRAPRSIAEYGEWAGFHPDGRRYEAHEWPLARTLEAGEVVVGEEIAIQRFDGTRGAISISSAPVREPDGSLVAAVAIVTDVTERREREGARDAFLGILAHELRTPLTTILGSARLLGRPSLAPAYRDGLVGDIEAEAERMARVIENLLVISRVERGIPIHADDPILVQRILPQVVEAERNAWAGVRFEVSFDNALPSVRGEDGLLRQVLGNLLSNAAKYGGGEVIVRAEREDAAVRITVADGGRGIDPLDAPHVFDLFYRSSRTRDVAAGAGVGLFVVRQLVTAMGGDVHVEPAKTGARFVVRLPAYQSA
jgi:PAS domain S-box-containing protein